MTASPSGSLLEAVALSVSFVAGPALSSDTVAVGAEFATVALSLAAEPSPVPSFGVASTVTVSPASPWPACERSRAGPVAPATTEPFTFQT